VILEYAASGANIDLSADVVRQQLVELTVYTLRSVRVAMFEDRDVSRPVRERFGHGGEPTIELDAVASDAFRRGAREVRLDGELEGEEFSDSLAWDVGMRRVLVDPLDGTTNARTLMDGFAVAAMVCDLRSNERFRHIAGAIASSDGTVMSWTECGPVRLVNLLARKSDGQFGQVAVARVRAGNPDRIAMVGSSSTRRDLLRAAAADDSSWICSFGGNPVGKALLLGDLGSAIETHSVERWDAIMLWPLQFAGALVTTLAGERIDVADVFADPDPRRRMPPYIVATSEAALERGLVIAALSQVESYGRERVASLSGACEA
jgi:hypothetical protein